MSIFSFFSCNSNAQKVSNKTYSITLKTLLSHSVPEVSVADLEGELKEYDYILDTRALREFEVSQLKNAEYVGYDDFDMSRVEHISKDSKVLLYCSVGYRSEKIAERMRSAGYSDVTNLYGGIFEWKNQDFQVVDSVGQVTPQVHAFDKVWGRFLKKGEKVY